MFFLGLLFQFNIFFWDFMEIFKRNFWASLLSLFKLGRSSGLLRLMWHRYTGRRWKLNWHLFSYLIIYLFFFVYLFLSNGIVIHFQPVVDFRLEKYGEMDANSCQTRTSIWEKWQNFSIGRVWSLLWQSCQNMTKTIVIIAMAQLQ